MSILGRVVVACALGFVVACGGNAKGDSPDGVGGASATEGGAPATGGSPADGPETAAEERCRIKADARMKCHGDYDGYDSRDEYIAGCLEDNDFSCDLYDIESVRPVTACQAICGDDTMCLTDAYTAVAAAHPERVEADKACAARVDECFPDADPESLDSSYRGCFGYLFSNEAGTSKLDACVSGSCEEFSACLDSAFEC